MKIRQNKAFNQCHYSINLINRNYTINQQNTVFIRYSSIQYIKLYNAKFYGLLIYIY